MLAAAVVHHTMMAQHHQGRLGSKGRPSSRKPTTASEVDPATLFRQTLDQMDLTPLHSGSPSVASGEPSPGVGSAGGADVAPVRPGAFPPELSEDNVRARRDTSPAPSQGDLQLSFDATKPTTPDTEKKRREVAETGVKQWVYAGWIRDEMEREGACLELPFTILLLASFSLLSLTYVNQRIVTTVEQAIVNDVTENANFAFAHNFGHKDIDDVNSYADFWSWCRLGFVPLLAPKAPWPYSEGLADAVPRVSGVPAYDVRALPTRRPMPAHRREVPVRNDYLRYNRIIGGFRFGQRVAQEPSVSQCLFPGDANVFGPWLGKPCTQMIQEYTPPDLYATEHPTGGERAQWFLMDSEDHDTLIQRVIDMEDGCTSAMAQNRSCLCEWCAVQVPGHPWLNELTQRVEITFVVYNAQYGLYCLASINFYFSRSGHIHKLVNVRSSWAGLLVRDRFDLGLFVLSSLIWFLCTFYVTYTEVHEIKALIRTKPKPWYRTMADDYIDFWNCVDWVSITIAAVLLCFFVALTMAVEGVNTALARVVRSGPEAADHAEQVRRFYSGVVVLCTREWHFRIWLCIYPLVVLMRLFKSFSAQPRLAIVPKTFEAAWDDLVHFGTVFLSVYICFTVNGVLVFGQDSLDFATLDRALHSSFRTMLGDWDWDEMRKVGLVRAFLWFFCFMLVMVLLLLNMLLAILMESYATAKEMAENAPSLLKQVQNMIRRNQQSRRGERVRLKDIWEALLSQEQGDKEATLNSETVVHPQYLGEIVPGIPWSQALRTLANSQEAYDLQNNEPFGPNQLEPALSHLEERLDNLVLCSSWLANKLETSHRQLRGPRRESSHLDEDDEHVAFVDPPSRKSSPRTPAEGEPEVDPNSEGIEAVRWVAQERTVEMGDGVAAVLGAEMQQLERRQVEQHRSMQDVSSRLGVLRHLIYKLGQTCEEVAQLTQHLEEGARSSSVTMGAGAGKAPPASVLMRQRQRSRTPEPLLHHFNTRDA